MRILAVILGTFVALFGVAFGGCAVALGTAEFWRGLPDPGVLWLILVNLSLAALLLRVAYQLFRGPRRPRDAHEAGLDP